MKYHMSAYIKQMSSYDYLLDSMLSLPPLGTYFVRQCIERDGIILEAHIEERTVGIVVIEIVPKPKLTYVFVEEAFRGKGIATQLIRDALAFIENRRTAEVEACVILQNKYGDVIDHIFMKTGFEIINTANIIRYANDEKCRRTWAAFMKEKGKRICDTLMRRGYKTFTFSEASLETFEKLKNSIGSQFVSNLDPFTYISDKNDRLVPDYSFITQKDDELAAFVTVTTADDKTLVFQQISIALRHQGNGAFLLPFAAFMERFLGGGAYNKVAAVILGKNEKMQRLVQSFIGSLSESMKTQNVYQYRLRD
ncbi:GNAT family N-acetyltransferase [Anaerobacterium chartisolvens]|uniref:GNAT family N-acetyltransferase n=1 Tax=Anaerobacterium chartisolvens TaxID=1297424 RepID=UPI001A9A339D|nr:GNAT family N-acetyltransferase [Anaerobacterium chartisolvens]